MPQPAPDRRAPVEIVGPDTGALGRLPPAEQALINRTVRQDPEQAAVNAAHDRQQLLPDHLRETVLSRQETLLLATAQRSLHAQALMAVRTEAMATGDPQLQMIVRNMTATPPIPLDAAKLQRLEEILDRPRVGGRPSIREHWIDSVNARLEASGSNLRVAGGPGMEYTVQRYQPGEQVRDMTATEQRFLREVVARYPDEVTAHHQARLRERQEIVREFNRAHRLPDNFDPTTARITQRDRIAYTHALNQVLTARGYDLAGEVEALNRFKAGVSDRINTAIALHNQRNPGDQMDIRMEPGLRGSSLLRLNPGRA